MKPIHVVLAILVAVIWGFNFVVIKIGLDHFPPFLFSAIRFFFAAIPAVFFIKWPQVNWRRLLAIGFVLGVVKFSLMFLGIEIGVSAGMASLLIQMQVPFTALLALLFLSERPTSAQIGGIALGFAGLMLIVIQNDSDISLLGLLLIVGAALAWAYSNILTKGIGKVNMFDFTVAMSLVPILPMLLLSYGVEGHDQITAALSQITWISLGTILYVAFVATVAAYAIWGALLLRYPASLVTPYALLVPVVGMISSAMVLGEQFTFMKILAATLVIVGLVVGNLGDKLTARFMRTRLTSSQSN